MWLSCKQYFTRWSINGWKQKKNYVSNFHIPPRSHLCTPYLFLYAVKGLSFGINRFLSIEKQQQKNTNRSKKTETYVFCSLAHTIAADVRGETLRKHKQIMISTSHQLYTLLACTRSLPMELLINSNFIGIFHRHFLFGKREKNRKIPFFCVFLCSFAVITP